MTAPPAFSDIPQGSKTGTGFVHDPESEAFIADCAEEELLPAEEWCRRLGYIIADPDGWRGRQALPWETPIARDDFVARAGVSTCLAWPAALAQHHVRRIERPDAEPQTFDLTYRFTGITKHNPRLMLEATFRAGLPRGVTFEEVTDAG